MAASSWLTSSGGEGGGEYTYGVCAGVLGSGVAGAADSCANGASVGDDITGEANCADGDGTEEIATEELSSGVGLARGS